MLLVAATSGVELMTASAIMTVVSNCQYVSFCLPTTLCIVALKQAFLLSIDPICEWLYASANRQAMPNSFAFLRCNVVGQWCCSNACSSLSACT